jgi:hypothetical protein
LQGVLSRRFGGLRAMLSPAGRGSAVPADAGRLAERPRS